ncbi:MAG: alpha/beta fold hydrolase [Methylophaga sp.]|nr:alpha/beta fold hydrolase [Methylophaga sp.]
MDSKKKYKPPFVLKIMRVSIHILTFLAPPLAARLVNYLWFKTHRHDEPRREQRILDTAVWKEVGFESKVVQLYSWGKDNAPTVLLVHGWNGRGAQLGSFVQGLVDHGYHVLAFDAPGHGRSSSKNTNLPEISRVIQELSEQFGPFSAGIAHSFGGLCLMHAVSTGVKMDKAVCIASAFNVERLVQFFAKLMQVKPKIVERQKRLLEQQFGEELWQQYSMPNMVRKISTSGLIIHDDGDDAIPVDRSKMIAQVWNESELVLTSGLGHRRILRDKAVITKAVEFIAN